MPMTLMFISPRWRFFSHIGHYRVLRRVPCAIQQVLIIYYIYIYTHIYIQQYGFYPKTIKSPEAFKIKDTINFPFQSDHLSFPCGSAGKESAYNVEDLGSVPGLGRSPGEGKGYPLQYSGLENSMDCIVRGVAKSQTQLSDFHFHFHSGNRAER